jgi:hypothetical protein
VAGTDVENRSIFVGDRRYLLMFPIKSGKVLNFGAFKDGEGVPWTQSQWVAPSPGEGLLHDINTTTTHSGAGAGFTIENVRLLSGLLILEYV